VRSEWLPYLSLYRALACYQGEAYECTIHSAEQALAINPDMVDGYYLRALASAATDDPQTAVDDLTHVIDSGSEIMAEYYRRRARAYKDLDKIDAACADLRSALDARRWGLSAEQRKAAEEHWDTWECSSTPGQGKE
jgi:tetratricopeptide (TPR) repeat protein